MWAVRLSSQGAVSAGRELFSVGTPIAPGPTGGECVKSRFDLVDFRFRAFFQIDQRVSRRPVDPDQLVELQLKRLRVAVLGALDDEDHQERHDGGTGIDDELPGIGPAEEWPGRAPHGDGQQRHREGNGSANLMLRPTRHSIEARGGWSSGIPGVAAGHSGWRLPATDALPMGAQSALDPTGQQKNDYDQQQEAEAAARVISPTAAIRPARQRPNQDKNEDNQQDSAEHFGITVRISLFLINEARERRVPGGRRPNTIVRQFRLTPADCAALR